MGKMALTDTKVKQLKPRELRDKARADLAKGIDPSEVKKAAKATLSGADSFAAIAFECYGKQEATWATVTAKKRLSLLSKDLISWLGSKHLDNLTSKDLLMELQRIEDRGAKDSARNARQVLAQIFRYARVTSRTTNDPVADLQTCRLADLQTCRMHLLRT
jgi:hypothetical protein